MWVIFLNLSLSSFLAVVSAGIIAEPERQSCSDKQVMRKATVNDRTFWTTDDTFVLDNDKLSLELDAAYFNSGMAGGALNMYRFSARTQKVGEISVTCRESNGYIKQKKTQPVRFGGWQRTTFSDFLQGCAHVQAEFINKKPGTKTPMQIKAVSMTACRVKCKELEFTDPHLNMDVNHANVNWTSGTEASFYCDIGYELIGADTLLCEDSGSWSAEVPTCSRIVCPTPGVVDWATVTENNFDEPPPYGTGSTINYVCNPTYAMKNGGILNNDNDWTITCLLTTEDWDQDEPTCEKIKCNDLGPEPSNSVRTPTWADDIGDFTVNTYFSYACNDGYSLSGDTLVTCQEVSFLGEWSGPQPTCERIICSPFIEDDIVDVYISSEVSQGDQFISWATGSEVSFGCPEGYMLQDGAPWTCDQSGDVGVWTTDTPWCDRIYCDPLSTPVDGSIAVTWVSDGTGIYAYGVSADYDCDAGFYRNGASTITCGNVGWDSSPPTCDQVMCSALPDIDNGQFLSGGIFPAVVDQCENYGCFSDYVLVGGSELCCEYEDVDTATGSWSGDVPECKYKYCNDDFNFNVQVSVVSPWVSGTVVTLSCPTGFRLVGTSTLTCVTNAAGDRIWNAAQPACEAAFCSALTLDDGYYTPTPDWGLGNCYTVNCYLDFFVQGSSTICCEDVSGTNSWDADPPACERKKCDSKGNPSKGTITTNHAGGTDWGTGTVLTYTCINDYFVDGPEVLTCIHVGGVADWDQAEPTCERQYCESLTLTNGMVTVTHGNANYYKETCVVFLCDFGYKVVGNAGACCLPDDGSITKLSWNSAVPTCTEITCDPLNSGSNMLVTAANYQPPPDYRIQTTLTVSCVAGYTLMVDGNVDSDNSLEIECIQVFGTQGVEGAWNKLPSCIPNAPGR